MLEWLAMSSPIRVVLVEDHTIVRVSAQGYNTKAQMDILIGALTSLLTLEDAA